MTYYPLIQEQKQQKTYKQIIYQNNMKIRKYIDSKDLIKFEEVLQYAYDCDYCIVNYSEEGDKASVDILKSHLDQAIDAQEMMDDETDGKFLESIKNLLKMMEENEIDFVRIY